MANKSIGQFIAALRKANGLTQKELAEKLNVSDKAISRWERDECSPDISLIPVIAEIFSVTCDELLCGERKAAEAVKSNANDAYLSPKAEKQQQRILKATLSEFKNRSCVVIAVAILGLVAAAVCNLGFNRAYIGFFVSVSFFAVSVVCQLVFTNKAFFSVSDVNTGDEEIGRLKCTFVNIAGGVLSFIAVLTAFCLPLVIFPDDSYLGIEGKSWMLYGALYAVPFLLASLLLCSFAGLKTAKKENLHALYKKCRHNLILKAGSLAVLAVVLFITFGVYNVITESGDPAALTEGKIYDKEAFVTLMETEVEQENTFNSIYNIAESDDFEEEAEDEDAENYDFITDDNNNVVCKFVHRNESVVSYEYEFNSDGELLVKVITTADWQEGMYKLNIIKTVFAVVYIAEIVSVAVFYCKKRKSIK